VRRAVALGLVASLLLGGAARAAGKDREQELERLRRAI